jgi:hypothetical protein
MSKEINSGGCCCTKPIQSLSRLTFPDGTHVGIIGLDAILKAMLAEDRPANAETAEEIVRRLKEKNYIPFSIIQEYETLLLGEYRKYIQDQKAKGPER